MAQSTPTPEIPAQSSPAQPSPDRRALKRQYRETLHPMGVYVIRNLHDGKVYLAASLNLEAALNRERFQLKMRGHPSPELQAAWDAAGEAMFSVEVLDRLKPRDEPGFDYRPELESLLSLWREDLAQTGVSFYAPAPHLKIGVR